MGLKMLRTESDDSILSATKSAFPPNDDSEAFEIHLDHVTIQTPARVIKNFCVAARRLVYKNYPCTNYIYDEMITIIGVTGDQFYLCRKVDGTEGLVPKGILRLTVVFEDQE